MTANEIHLEGRCAVVTGGARGIGRAIVERFVRSGARVAIWDRDGQQAAVAAREIDANGAVHAQTIDVTDIAAVEAALKATEDAQGPTDILVTSAGITGPIATVADYPPEEWRRVIEIDLIGVYACLRAVGPGMSARGYGRIVNIASIAGKEGNPNASAYSAAKAGVIALTKSLGKELAGLDIAVNCVTPAAARTAIFDQMTEEHIGYMLAKIPRGRFVDVAEIAGLVAWLASAENAFATGAVFDISGGRATY